MRSQATSEEWADAQPLERSFWESEDWRSSPASRRRLEWGRHLASLNLTLDEFADQAVLDVGCGPSGIACYVEARRRVGLDPLAEVYEQWNGDLGDQIELVAAQAEIMPFPDDSFDTVFCINSLDHVQNANTVLTEIARVLQPGGRLVLHVDLDSPLRWLHKRVRPHVGQTHPLALSYAWLRQSLASQFTVLAERRDPETFKPTWENMRYEAFWDGLLYRLTRGSPTWMHHVWLTARRD